MINLTHICDDCDSEYTIRYDAEKCESDPQMCPFCGSYILDKKGIEDTD